MLTLAVDIALSQPNLLLSRSLVEIGLLHRFESAGRLVYHVRNRANILEVKAPGPHPVYTDVTDHKHA